MTSTLRGILIVCIIIYFVVVFQLLRKGRLALKYSLLWLVMGVVMAILVLLPNVLFFMSGLFGIVDTMNALFTFAVAFMMMLLMSLTAIASKQSDRIKNLVQDNAMLEKRIRELEEKMMKM